MAELTRDEARAHLAALLPRVMADGRLDADEKKELVASLTAGVLGRDDVRAVFRDFLMGLHREVMADGQLTPDEQARLRTVIGELRIPSTFLPPEIAALVGG